ncbi:hypothetical protein [Arthrobacter sp. NyZ413]|uniref:hypothetical protein n=1 Tax=Arthrobacter sp. NyZ413 TaxID=3144669 RepID=UPI003BF7B4DB
MLKIIGEALGGLVAGLACAFILCVVIGVIALSTDSSATLPGVFSATAGRQNGALALEFQPNFPGLAAVICLTALANVLVVARCRDASQGSSDAAGRLRSKY